MRYCEHTRCRARDDRRRMVWLRRRWYCLPHGLFHALQVHGAVRARVRQLLGYTSPERNMT